MAEAALEQRVASVTGYTPDHVGNHMHLPEFWQRYLTAMLDAGVRMTFGDEESSRVGIWGQRVREYLAQRRARPFLMED